VDVVHGEGQAENFADEGGAAAANASDVDPVVDVLGAKFEGGGDWRFLAKLELERKSAFEWSLGIGLPGRRYLPSPPAPLPEVEGSSSAQAPVLPRI